MHIKRIGQRFLNLDLMTDAYWDGQKLTLAFVSCGGTEENFIGLSGEHASEMMNYLGLFNEPVEIAI